MEKSLESPWDWREIQLVHSRGDQPWVFFGRNDAKAETPVLWPPHVKTWLTGKRLWCWEGLGAGGEGDDRGWDGWMASLTQWTWVWVNSGGWWWTGRPGVLRFMGSQRVGHDWATELNKVLMVIIQHYEFFKSHRIGQQRVNFTIWKFKLKFFTVSLVTFLTLILSTGENGKEKFLPFFQFEKR